LEPEYRTEYIQKVDRKNIVQRVNENP